MRRPIDGFSSRKAEKHERKKGSTHLFLGSLLFGLEQETSTVAVYLNEGTTFCLGAICGVIFGKRPNKKERCMLTRSHDIKWPLLMADSGRAERLFSCFFLEREKHMQIELSFSRVFVSITGTKLNGFSFR